MTVLATATLFVMMLALGMTLTAADFRRVVARPQAVGLGLLGQLVILPAVAFALARLFELPDRMALGLVLVAACPGGATSNLFSYVARGDVALSITLTAASSMLSFLSVPFVLQLGMRTFVGDGKPIELSLLETGATLFGTTAVPVLLGMALLHLRPAWAGRLQRPLLGVSGTILVVLIIGLFGATWGSSERDMSALAARALPSVIALVAVTTAVGAGLARITGLGAAVARTLAIEIGIQNVNLAFFVAISILDEPLYAGVAVLYLPIQLVVAGLIVGLGRRAARAETTRTSEDRGGASPDRGGPGTGGDGPSAGRDGLSAGRDGLSAGRDGRSIAAESRSGS